MKIIMTNMSICEALSGPNFRFNSDDAIKHGIEKTIIYHNIGTFGLIPSNEIHLKFPYIEKERFYELVEELKDDNLIFEGDYLCQ